MDALTILMFVVVLVLPAMLAIGLVNFNAGVRRLERATGRIEEALETSARADKAVAKNLASSVSRADATIGPDGAAADAALRTGDTAEAITERQDRERQGG